MTKTKKSWQKKFSEEKEGFMSKKETDRGLMYISCPMEISQIISKVPKGKLITTKQIVEKLNKKHQVDFTCQLTTGIFIGIAANKTEEDREEGRKNLTPYWRVIKPDGQVYEKYMGQPSKQIKLLEREGFKIVDSGYKTKAPIVKDFEKYLI